MCGTTHLDNLVAFASLALAICDREVREQRRMADDGREGVAMLVREPLAVVSFASKKPDRPTYYLVMSGCPVPT